CDGSTGRCTEPSTDGGSGDGGTGATCTGDSDCLLPFYVCGSQHECVKSCVLVGCPTGLSCNTSTGRCAFGDGGTGDGGTGDGGSGDGGTAFAGCTNCGACEVDAECAGGGLCAGGFCALPCTQASDCSAFGIGYSCDTLAGHAGKYCLSQLNCILGGD